jgi:UDP-N-acetyl-2-amino-2-deoxyglucuronate dehydrogenase
MDKTLHVAIVGCGRVAGHHVRAIDNHPSLALAAICDLKTDRMESMPGTGAAPRFTNYHEMFRKHPEIDIVAIVTPSGMHFEHALDAVKRYGKSVVIEKPVVMRLTQGDELGAAARAAPALVPAAAVLRSRCLARHLRARRWLHYQPGHSSPRHAALSRG